jgi:predicted porin
MMAVPCAYAQSSVTLYGIIDAGITYFSNLNGHGTFVANDGSIQSNRWGLLGSEDLGGGAKAIFQLENGFNLYNGTMVQSGVLFSRQAWVGLTDTTHGTLTLGKQYDFFWDNLTQFAMGQYAGQYAWHPGDFDHLAGTLHINNALKYKSPTFYGFSFGALYAFPSQSVPAGTGRVIAFGARYDGGPFQAGVAYTDTHDLGLNAPTQAGTTLFPDLPGGTGRGHERQHDRGGCQLPVWAQPHAAAFHRYPLSRRPGQRLDAGLRDQRGIPVDPGDDLDGRLLVQQAGRAEVPERDVAA